MCLISQRICESDGVSPNLHSRAGYVDFPTAKEPACAELYRDAAVRYASNACDAHKAQRAAEERIAELEAEVNRLKAKLYDYMVKEAIQ